MVNTFIWENLSDFSAIWEHQNNKFDFNLCFIFSAFFKQVFQVCRRQNILYTIFPFNTEPIWTI